LTRLSTFSFPVNLNETTRAFFERTAQMEGGRTAEICGPCYRANPILPQAAAAA